MASSQGPTVVLTFAGDSGPLERTAKKVTSTMGSLGKALGGLSSAGAGVQAIGGLAGALTQLAPAALLLPGALLAAKAAMVTFSVATAGMSDAISAGLSGDMAAFAEATKDMAPAARDTAKEFAAFKPQVDALKQSVQGAFFEGFASQVREVGGQLLPILSTGMTKVAGGFNKIGLSALDAAKNPFFQEDIGAIFANTGQTLDNMRHSLGNVMQGFVGLGGVGSTYLPALGTAIDDVAGKFNAWVQSGVEDGSIKAMIDGALAGFRELGAIAVNIGSILGSVFTGLGGDATSFLTPLREATAQLATFLASASAQEALGALGEAMRAAGTLLREVFISALAMLAPIVTALAPVVAGVASTLASWAPILGPVAVGILAIAGAMRVAAAGVALYNGIAKGVQAVTTAWTGVQWLLNAALSANPIALVVIAIAALVAGLIWAYNESETFRGIVLGAWEAVKSGISAAVDWIVGAVQWFGQLPGMIGGWFGEMKDAAIAKAGELVAWVKDLPNKIMTAVGNLGTLLLNAGRDLLTGLWNGISGAAGWLRDKIFGFFSGLVPQWAKDFLGIRSPSKVFADIGQYIPAGLAVGIEDNTGVVSSATAGMATAATSGMQAGVAPVAAAPAAGGGGREVRFTGNVDSAFATAFMKLVRTGQIQIT